MRRNPLPIPRSSGGPLFATENSIQRITGLVNERLRVVLVWMEVFERDVPAVIRRHQRIHDCGPIGRAIQQRAKRFERVVGALFGELFEVDVLRALGEDGHPVFRELEHRNVARVEMDADVFALKAVHKRIHLHRGHEVAVEENVLDVQKYFQFRSLAFKYANRFLGPPVANVIWHRFMIRAPRNMHRARDHEHVFNPKVMRRLGNFARQFHASCALVLVVAAQRVRPKEKRAKPTDLDSDLVSELANLLIVLGPEFRGQVVFEIVI